MEQVASGSRRAFFLRVLAPVEPLDPPFDGEPYPALVWATVSTADAQKFRIARALIASACRYLVCDGVENRQWQDAADHAYKEQELDEPVPDELFVVTASHGTKPEDEVAFFFVHNTSLEGARFHPASRAAGQRGRWRGCRANDCDARGSGPSSALLALHPLRKRGRVQTPSVSSSNYSFA